MKQLIRHIMLVRFINPSGVVIGDSYDVADIKVSRDLGRRIGQWLAKGVGYKVESETVEMHYVHYESH